MAAGGWNIGLNMVLSLILFVKVGFSCKIITKKFAGSTKKCTFAVRIIRGISNTKQNDSSDTVAAPLND